MAAIQAVTATVCFQANSRGDGKNFLERYICLQVPLTIRFWVICIPASFLVGVVVFFINMPESVLLAVMLLIGLGILWAYIAYLRSLIVKVAAPPADGDLTAAPPASV
ncbi:MAG: hypothetical protein RIN56_10285 [Sporomusaceae bacterium]|nr:hypothetical protein [Sporomusaceae bacterium]